MLNSLLIVLLLCPLAPFFSLSEISLAASRRIKLKQLVDEGNINVARVLKCKKTPVCFYRGTNWS